VNDFDGSGLSPIRQETAPLRARIIEAIRGAIEGGQLKPGERLVEKKLCEQLGVSRTSLREALRELEAIGVIAQVSTRGLTVVEISPREARNIYAIRADIEALVVEQFCERADDAAMQRFDQLCTELTETYRAGNFSAIIAGKKKLFNHLCEVADNAVALELLQRLTLRTAQLRNRSVAREARQQQSITEIEELQAAVLARDSQTARRSAHRHVESAADSALDLRKS
tara:strand:+ start:4661 stop:5341 length:681 start_codon:yes stop_codon:yes gene_type:complete